MLNDLLVQEVVGGSYSFFGHSLMISLTGYGIAVVVSSTVLYVLYLWRLSARALPPPISTWTLWLLLDIAATYAEFSKGVFNIQLVMYTIGTAVVCVALLPRLNKAWDAWWDSITALFVLASIAALLLTTNPLHGLIVSLTGMSVATLPLLRAVAKGADEPVDAWVVCAIGSIFTYLDGHVLSSIWLGSTQLLIIGCILHYQRERGLQSQ
jgi:hypothetical protein